VVQLLAELRLVANARPGGQLDPHLPILNPPLLGTDSWHYPLILLLTYLFLADTNAPHMAGNFDAHAVYAGDDAVSSHGRWATAGVRNALSALISYHGLDSTYNPTTSASAISRLPSNKPPGQSNLAQNLFLPSTSSQQSTFSS